MTNKKNNYIYEVVGKISLGKNVFIGVYDNVEIAQQIVDKYIDDDNYNFDSISIKKYCI